jgi:hypothetical protein
LCILLGGSETGAWGNIISATARCEVPAANPGILVGNVLYWLSESLRDSHFDWKDQEVTDDIIEFDLDKQSLAVSKGPPDLNGSIVHQIIKADGGAVGLVIYSHESHGRFKIWERNVTCHGTATWLLQKTVEMHTVLGLPSQIERSLTELEIVGYDEDNSVIFVHADASVYMFQHMSMESRKICGSCYHPRRCHPFTSFYASGDCSSFVLVLL